MGTVRDLRELVNVSRLTYRDSDDEDASSTHSATFRRGKYSVNEPVVLKQKAPAPLRPVPSKLGPSETQAGSAAAAAAVARSSVDAFLRSTNTSLVFGEREMVLDRHAVPRVSLTSIKRQPLPPLERQVDATPRQLKQSPTQRTAVQVPPLPLQDETDQKRSNDTKLFNEAAAFPNGNFDNLLTYIDASVVSEWLNRANRLLKKMHRWHANDVVCASARPCTATASSKAASTSTAPLKHASFISFANFWLGAGTPTPLDSRQRRQLLELEYSILCDEVSQAFQVGLDAGAVSVSDIYALLRAVFKEYPLQLLSFRGVYLLLDCVDVLSVGGGPQQRGDAEHHAAYKRLLSDVKCRTLNRQCAQWLLSIRSFALISVCWSVIKFYRRAAHEHQQQQRRFQSGMDELDGRLSSLSVAAGDQSPGVSSSSDDARSSSADSSEGSDRLHRPGTRRPNTAKSTAAGAALNVDDLAFDLSNTQAKYELYFQAALKNDFADVLHYLIVTKKCDVFKRDEQGRTLVFLAVVSDKPKILNYLVKRWPSIDINEACHSGNTPLHAAVNSGKLNLVEILLSTLTGEMWSSDALVVGDNDDDEDETSFTTRRPVKLDVNKPNARCMNATALHLAVWGDHVEIALRLVQARADPHLKMNETSTAFDLALENHNQVLYELLCDYHTTPKATA